MRRETVRSVLDQFSVLPVVWMALLLGTVTFVGQWGRELLTHDDFREVEVAREMSEEGNFVVPKLAGLPFVEKPPGFPALLAGTFKLIGHPSTRAARLVSAGFAYLSVVASFLLGRSILGAAGGLVSGAFLALSPLYLGASHTILLDNALSATVAFSLYFGWRAISQDTPIEKTRSYAAAGFMLGLAFLVKGLVGPALVGSGLLVFLGLTRRWGELKYAMRPVPLLVFLAPIALWIIPFLHRAPPRLIYEFFVLNHFGRFADAYEGHPRPLYFYIATLSYLFAPGVVFLPTGIWQAWKERRHPERAGSLFALAFSVGPLALLSLSRAKDAVYLLPAYPCLALLAAAECLRAARSNGRSAPMGVVLIGFAGVGTSLAAVAATAFFETVSPRLLIEGLGVLGLVTVLVRVWREKNVLVAGFTIATLFVVAGVLYYGGPLHRMEIERRPWRWAAWNLAAATRGRPLLIHAPDDTVRGGLGFYRQETPREVPDPASLVSLLAEDSGSAAIVLCNGGALPCALQDEAAGRRVELVEELRCRYRYDTWLVLIHARHPEGGAEASRESSLPLSERYRQFSRSPN